MSGSVEVREGVAVRARVAAADVAAGQTHAQMRPRVLSEFRALLAITRCQGLGFNPGSFTVGREVLACFGDRCGVRIAPT
jgi:hypothetical protein